MKRRQVGILHMQHGYIHIQMIATNIKITGVIMSMISCSLHDVRTALAASSERTMSARVLDEVSSSAVPVTKVSGREEAAVSERSEEIWPPSRKRAKKPQG